MITEKFELPYYIKLCAKLLMLFLIGSIVCLGKGIIVPIYFSVLLAILLLPIANFLETLKIPKGIADLIAILVAIIVIAGVIYFFSSQISSFLSDVPSIKSHLNDHYNSLRDWIKQKFHISFTEQNIFIRNAVKEITSSGGQYIGQTFTSLTTTILVLVLVIIYTFLILFYRHLIKKFLLAVFLKEHGTRVEEVLSESKSIVKNYMIGLLIEMVIVASANAILLLLIGIKYALFLGVFIAILNIVPYIGIISGILFTSLITLTTSSHTSDIFWIVVLIGAVHIIDSNFLMPRIVGSKVKVNALMAITGVVFGGAIMGLAGIFLALPTMAILKIIFDRVEGLKPWGIILGGEIKKQKNKKVFIEIKNTPK